jgi:predicted RNA-binding Zn-ribbon protein involved in translation (DUF1610 family)
MDHALALHIGVAARVLARQHMETPVDGPPRELASKAWRKFEQAGAALNEADEAEDFQAVGMRLRECLIAFAQETAAEASVPESTERPKRSDFKGWAELIAQAASPGRHGVQIRSYLRALSRETWDLVNWLTHAANATRADADMAVDATGHLLTAFSLALIREQHGKPFRCPSCGSYQVTMLYESVEDATFLVCEACGWRDRSPETP